MGDNHAGCGKQANKKVANMQQLSGKFMTNYAAIVVAIVAAKIATKSAATTMSILNNIQICGKMPDNNCGKHCEYTCAKSCG
jgi:hypothetical protein